MSGRASILEKIFASRKKRVAEQRAAFGAGRMRELAVEAAVRSAPHQFLAAITRSEKPGVIAEFKRASPSKGVINQDVDVGRKTRSYESDGAAAI